MEEKEYGNHGMKFFKYIIYFMLFANAALNLVRSPVPLMMRWVFHSH